MEIFAIWCIFCVVVGVAANARGRSGFSWFLASMVISPLIATAFVVLMRDLRQERLLEKADAGRRVPAPTYLNPTRTVDDKAPPKARFLGKASRVTIDRTPKPFEPDGVYAGIPYRVVDGGGVDAVMQGTVVRFTTLEKFTAAVGDPSAG
ncbi:MAG: hypothetical protein Q8L13_11575 [Bradyrhizobium sp.]|uniref:hypothetical protein n=1 Tax=Bradyrhizobium sp. TaxID=376 RepID=UPI00272F0A0F|nr:hypothetical protein [Bradyrhizobium sp.]MDP1866964.1 hypothetical protein [Bradyrhizobium sp.]